jgi:hypothetical protein
MMKRQAVSIPTTRATKVTGKSAVQDENHNAIAGKANAGQGQVKKPAQPTAKRTGALVDITNKKKAPTTAAAKPVRNLFVEPLRNLFFSRFLKI